MTLETELRSAVSFLRSKPWLEWEQLASRVPSVAQMLRQLQELLASRPIELAEIRASPKQRAVQQAFLSRRQEGRKVSVFALLGGNRSGKSIAAGTLCFARYLIDHAVDGDAFWCVAPTLDKSVGAGGGQQKQLSEILPRWALGDQLWTPKIGFGMHRKIVLPTKDGGRCVVEFLSADQQPTIFEAGKIRGIWVDERLPEAIYDRLLARIIDTDGWILYSDIPEQWWQFQRLMTAKPEAGVFYQHFTMHDNAHNLPVGAIAEAESRMTDDQKRLRIYGQMVRMQGLVHKAWDRRRHLVRPFRIPAYWPRWRLIDYGSSAPTACVWVALSEDEIAYVYRLWYDRGHSIAYNADSVLKASGSEVYRATLMDPTCIAKPPAIYGDSLTVAEQYAAAGLQARGWPWINVMGKHALVQRVEFRLETETLKVFETCVDLVREFESWKYVCDEEGRPKAADSFEDDNDHALSCLQGFFGSNPTFAPQKIEVAR